MWVIVTEIYSPTHLQMPNTPAVAYNILKCGPHSGIEKGEESLEIREYKKREKKD